MSRTHVDVIASLPTFRSKLKNWLEWSKYRLYPYRPRFRDWRFWLLQGLIILIAVVHIIVEAEGFLHDSGVPYFIPITLFLVPVVYAALTFGFVGAITTALWITVITIPNWILWHQGLERFGVMFQMLIINAVAFFVGRRVDRERNAWQQAETTATALKTSRMKYRSLFESSPIAILVLDLTGVILEANTAANVLFSKDKATLQGILLADLIGTTDVQKLLDSSHNGGQPDSLTLKLKNGQELYLEPTLTEAGDGQSDLVIQILLRDVTEEHHRQAGLRAYAAHVMRAQEEERQRIARELHDETIQSLVLLCRRLDSMENDSESLPSSLINNVREARKIADETVKGLRGFAKALRPPILDDLGMMTSIRRLLVDFKERTKVKSKLTVAGEDRRLSPDTELAMFRIAQEALWNVEHHAEATRVDVTINFTEDKVKLDVIDNGVGFSIPPDSSDFIASGHLGLISMQERAELLSGKLEIQSSPGKGTKVIASIPIVYGITKEPNHRLDPLTVEGNSVE